MGKTSKLFRAVGSAFDIKDTIMFVRAGISALGSGSLTGGLVGALTKMPIYSIILISLGAGLLTLLFAPQIIKRIWVSPPEAAGGSQSVVSHNQSGGQTAGNITNITFNLSNEPPLEEKGRKDV